MSLGIRQSWRHGWMNGCGGRLWCVSAGTIRAFQLSFCTNRQIGKGNTTLTLNVLSLFTEWPFPWVGKLESCFIFVTFMALMEGCKEGRNKGGRKKEGREGARKVLRATIKVLNLQKVSSMVSLRHVCLIWRGAPLKRSLCTPGEPLVYRQSGLHCTQLVSLPCPHPICRGDRVADVWYILEFLMFSSSKF